MTKKLEQEIKDLDILIFSLRDIRDKLEVKLGNNKDKQKGWLLPYNEYWYIYSFDEIYKGAWTDHPIDKYRLQTRNIFRTKENAELWLKIHNKVHELIGSWEPGWGTNTKSKYLLVWNYEDNKPSLGSIVWNQFQGTTYMPKEVAEQLIEEFGNDLKIWICGEEL